MRKKREYTWYVEPLDSNTNQVISELVDQENFCAKVNLWKCDIGIVLALKRSTESLGLRFRIYNQEGNGKIRRVPLSIFKKKSFKKTVQ